VALAGPYCGLILAGLGADVIKIESPDGGDIARGNPPFYGPHGFHLDAMGDGDISVAMLARARNKKSVTLDLKSERGRELFMRLVKISDIVVENMSEGTAVRLGVGYETVKAANPRVVYASIAGLGDYPTFPGLKAMDIIVQALSGVMDVTGEADGPPTRFGLPIADLVAPLFASSGVLAALIRRGVTGVGQHVKVNMLDSMASLFAIEHFDVFKRAGFPMRSGNHMNRLCPFGVYATKDGYVAVAAPADKSVRLIAEAMGESELMEDPRFATRGPRAANADAFNARMENWTRRLTTEEVTTELFRRRGVSCVPVRTVDEVLSDPLLRASGAVEQLVHPKIGPIDAVGPGLPIKFSESFSGFDMPAQELGEGNPYVYEELLGLKEAEIAELKGKRII
jgi:formyl-CoA transferase